MIVNFKQPVLNLQGEPLTRSAENKTPATFEYFATQALSTAFKDEDLSMEAKILRHDLAARLIASESVEIRFFEAALIIELVNRVTSSPLIVSRFAELFETSSGKV